MPVPGSGKVIASVASAMPYTQNAVPASSPKGAPAAEERLDGVGIDRLRAVECEPPGAEVEVAGAAQRPGGERVRRSWGRR